MPTNKERLEANNAKIEAIQKTLQNKILKIKETGIEIILPEEFRSVTQTYYMKVSDDKLLISGGKTGLYEYTISTNSFKLVYMPENSYRAFNQFNQVSETKWLVFAFGAMSADVIVYNSQTSEVKKLDIVAYFGHVQIVDESRVLLSASYSNENFSGIYLYNVNDDSTIKIHSEVGNFNRSQDVGDEILFWSNDKEYTTVYIYYKSDNSVKPLYDGDYDLVYMNNVSNKYLFYSYKGFYDYNIETKTFNLIVETILDGKAPRFNRSFVVPNNKVLLSSQAYEIGLWLYNADDDSLKQIWTTGVWTENFYLFGDICLCYPTGSLILGLFSFNCLDDTFTQLWDKGYGIRYIKHLDDNKIFIGFQNSSNGAFVYNISTNTLTQLNTTSGFRAYYLKVSDTKILLFFTNGHPIAYNPADDSIYTIKYPTVNWYASYDTYIKDENGNYYLITSNRSEPTIPYYNPTDDSMTLGGYYLEV